MQATTVPEHVTLHGDDLQLISPRRTPASPRCTDYVYWDRRTSRELKQISHLPRKLERTIYVHRKKLKTFEFHNYSDSITREIKTHC